MLSSATASFILLVYSLICRGVLSEERLRELLLGEARTRIEEWYPDPSRTEAPETRNGVSISMLKQDMRCGGNMEPVTFAEFDITAARPVDVFNTMLDTPRQKEWNPQCASVTSAGDWQDQGVRAWAVVFNIPMVSDREFLQWQVADADFEKEEFWLVFSTNNNEQLRTVSPLQSGAVDSQNCLGAYRITKTPDGAHVIITQNVNAHPLFWFPLHQILALFPPAWQGTLDFVTQLSDRSKQLAGNGTSTNKTDAPTYMLIAPLTTPTTTPPPPVTFGCFALKGFTQFFGEWVIEMGKSAEQAKECKKRHDGHTSHAIVKVYHSLDGDIAKWFYAWMPRDNWHKKAIEAKVKEQFPFILGNINDVESKAESLLEWQAVLPPSNGQQLPLVYEGKSQLSETLLPTRDYKTQLQFAALLLLISSASVGVVVLARRAIAMIATSEGEIDDLEDRHATFLE